MARKQLWLAVVMIVLLAAFNNGQAQSSRQLTQLPTGTWTFPSEAQDPWQPAFLEGKFYIATQPTGGSTDPVIWQYDTLAQQTSALSLGTVPSGVSYWSLVGGMHGKLFFVADNTKLHPVRGYYLQNHSLWSYTLATGTWKQEIAYSSDTASISISEVRLLPEHNSILFNRLFDPTYHSAFETQQPFLLNLSNATLVDLAAVMGVSGMTHARHLNLYGDILFLSGVTTTDENLTPAREYLATYNISTGQLRQISNINLANVPTGMPANSYWPNIAGVRYFSSYDAQAFLNRTLVGSSPYVYLQWHPMPNGGGSFGPSGNAIHRINIQTGAVDIVSPGSSSYSFLFTASKDNVYHVILDKVSVDQSGTPFFENVFKLTHGSIDPIPVVSLDTVPNFEIGYSSSPNFSLFDQSDKLIFVKHDRLVSPSPVHVLRMDRQNNYRQSDAQFMVPAEFDASQPFVYVDDQIAIATGLANGTDEYFAVDLRNSTATQLTFVQTPRPHDIPVLGRPFKLNGRHYFLARKNLGTGTSSPSWQLYTIDLPSATTSNEADRAEADAPRWSVYPNPVDASSRVRFTLEQPTEVSASLYTSDGRELVITGSRRFEAGAHELSLPSFSGIGVVRVSIGGRTSSQKVLR